MKKILLGTSAIAGASLLAAGSAFAAEAPVLKFSGALGYEAVFNDGDSQAAGTGFNITANEQQSELVWDAHGTLDNGISYGAQAQWRWARTGDKGFDESWLDFKGDFGRVFLGAEDGVYGLIGDYHAQLNQVGAWGTDGNNALRHVDFLDINTSLHYYSTITGHTGDDNKIGYVSPSFGGLQVGISFAPEGVTGGSNGDGANAHQAAGSNNTSVANSTEIAAQYKAEFGDVSVGIGGAYIDAEDKSVPTGGGERHDIETWQVGAQVGFAGFDVVAGYGDNDDSGCPVSSADCDGGDTWSVGVAYNFGPGAVSASYQETESDNDGDNLDEETEIFHVGAQYKIAEGLSAYANAYFFDLDNGTETNDATVVILGTRVTF